MIFKCDSTLKGTITLKSAMSTIDDKELTRRYYSHEDGVGGGGEATDKSKDLNNQ